MEMFHHLFPVIFVAGLLLCYQTSSSSSPNGSLWKYKEVVTNQTRFSDSTGNIKTVVMEKCLNTSRMTDFIDWEASFEDNDNSFLLRLKRSNRRETRSQRCTLLSDTKNTINRILFPMILLLGLTLNGILLHIYWKHKELRTPRNTLFMNLAVSDTLFLIGFGVLQIISNMKHLEFSCFTPELCKTHVFFLSVWASVGAYSITLISVQRYLRVVKFNKAIIKSCVKMFVKPMSLITTVWTLSIVFAIPEVARSRMDAQGFKCRNPSLFIHGAYPFVLYGIVPFTIAAGFYWAVQRRPLQERLGAEFQKGDRPGRVLLSLGFVFVLTYVPVLVCDILKPGEDPLPREIYCYISKLLHLLNPVLCPLALCCASGRLRKYFIRYILCRCYCSDIDESPHASSSERRVTFPDISRTENTTTSLEMVVFKETQESSENAVSVL